MERVNSFIEIKAKHKMGERGRERVHTLLEFTITGKVGQEGGREFTLWLNFRPG